MSELALELIRNAKEKRLTKLDLGKCGLTELPDELFELVWLEELTLSDEWHQRNEQNGELEQKKSSNDASWNQIGHLSPKIRELAELRVFICSGNKISNITPIAALTNLNSLYISDNKIKDTTPLTGLTNIKSLDLRNNEISDITPITTLISLNALNLSYNNISNIILIAALTNLELLDLRNNDIRNIVPIAALTNLDSLNLSYNKICHITPITELIHLKSLDLRNNEISDIAPITVLVSLNALDLSYNMISDIKPITSLTNLGSLNLSDNEISNITPITALIYLNSLNLSYNKLTNITPLATLVNLKLLDLSYNEINNITPIATLINLNSLNLNYNKINNITAISTLLNLDSLDLNYNKINNIEAISALTDLNLLSLNGIGISDIAPVSALANLTSLNLSYNKINDITPLSTLANLSSLNLNYNKISTIEPLSSIIAKGIKVSLKEGYFDGKIIIADNPIENPPKFIIEQGNKAILDYLKNIEQQGAEKLNEAKLIIVGEPDAGKTTLMETLFDPSFELSKQTESTLGIEVRENWEFDHPNKPDTPFITNIWDFGGQQIQYMTHQFFLTPGAVYVLVSANDRKEPTNFPYWFKIIHLLGEEQGRYSPVLVVLNEKDDKFINKFNFDRKFYEDRYPELQISVCEVDLSTQNSTYDAMREQVQGMLTSLPHVTDDRPARWKDIRESLRKRAESADHISFTEYAGICTQHEVSDEDSQLLFSRYLHKLGSLLHFADDPALRNFIILNPQWAVDAVYSVLNDNEVAKNDGYFSCEQVDAIWKDKYNFDERGKLLNLMQKENFEICYPLDHDKQWFIAPQLLNAEQPELTWNETENLRFRFQYKFMPEGIITRLIVRLNSILARNTGNNQLIWRKGAVFAEKDCRAMVQEEENRDGLKIIDIRINGDNGERKYLLRRIRTEIHDLHDKWFRNIQAEEMIPCTCTSCIDPDNKSPNFFKFSVLKRADDKGKQTIECNRDFIDVPVIALLEGVFDNDDWRYQKLGGKRGLMDGGVEPEPARQAIDFNLNINTTEQSSAPAHLTTTSPIPNKPEEQPAPQKWYNQLCFSSSVLGVIMGMLSGYLFRSSDNFFDIGLITAIVTGAIVYMFLKLKQHYLRVAASGLFFLFSLPFTSPLFSFAIKASGYTGNGFAETVIKFGDDMNPWLAGVLGLAALGGGIYLLTLHDKQNKK